MSEDPQARYLAYALRRLAGELENFAGELTGLSLDAPSDTRVTNPTPSTVPGVEGLLEILQEMNVPPPPAEVVGDPIQVVRERLLWFKEYFYHPAIRATARLADQAKALEKTFEGDPPPPTEEYALRFKLRYSELLAALEVQKLKPTNR